MAPTLNVVAGIVYNQQGQVLLSSRPQGKAYAAYWEFAGGKVEADESGLQALQREFQEELGINIHHATPWLAKTHVYEHAIVHLRFFRVAANQWSGMPQARENQQFAWQNPAAPDVAPMLPANQHLLSVLSIPQQFSGSLEHGFIAPNGYQIMPHYIGTAEHENVLFTIEAWQKQDILPENRHTWVVVQNLLDFQVAQNASAVIWCIKHKESAQQLSQLLRTGSSLPIVVYVNSPLYHAFQDEWLALGAQAVVESKVLS